MPKSRSLWFVCIFSCYIVLFQSACKANMDEIPPLSPASPSQAGQPATVTPMPMDLPYEKAAKMFEVNLEIPLDVQNIGVEEKSGILIHDLTYASQDPQFGFPIKGRISAYLVTPEGEGPFAGVVFMHWLGSPNGNRQEFIEEALELAGNGIVSILVDGVFPWVTPPKNYDADRLQVIQQVIALRRAVEVLVSLPQVDPDRIGFVGHDYGAMYGAILSGVERRIKAYVLMAGMGSFSDWSLKYWPATGSKGADLYRQAMASVDPIAYISQAASASLLFQFSKNDVYITEAAALAFYNAGSDPKQIKWYDTSHTMNSVEDRQDRIAWLLEQLGK